MVNFNRIEAIPPAQPTVGQWVKGPVCTVLSIAGGAAGGKLGIYLATQGTDLYKNVLSHALENWMPPSAQHIPGFPFVFGLSVVGGCVSASMAVGCFASGLVTFMAVQHVAKRWL